MLPEDGLNDAETCCSIIKMYFYVLNVIRPGRSGRAV
jgi:hypothetical protein